MESAERRKLTAAQAIENVQQTIGEVPVVLSSVTVAEVGHGIYRANAPEIRERRRAFLGDLIIGHAPWSSATRSGPTVSATSTASQA